MAAALLLALAAPAAAQNSVDESERGIVRVVVIVENAEGRMLYGSGSGFVVAPHLVVPQRPRGCAGPPACRIRTGGCPARGRRPDPGADHPLLPQFGTGASEFTGGPDLPALTISTVEPHAGDGVVALGYPDVDYQGATGADLLRPAPASRTSGQISSLRDTAPTGEPIPSINHQAVISSGSSGGPLLDECGRVIGVNSWHVSGADTRETRGLQRARRNCWSFWMKPAFRRH